MTLAYRCSLYKYCSYLLTMAVLKVQKSCIVFTLVSLFHSLPCYFSSSSPFFSSTLVFFMDASRKSSPASFDYFHGWSLRLVMEYIYKYGRYLDAQPLGAMSVEGDQPSIYDRRLDKYCYPAVGAWIKRWRQYGCRHASVSQCVHESTDSPFIRC